MASDAASFSAFNGSADRNRVPRAYAVTQAEERHDKHPSPAPVLLREFTAFFGMSLTLFGLAQVVQKLVVPGLSPTMHMAHSWGLLLVVLVPVGWYVRRQSLPLSRMGLTSEKLGRSLAESAAVALLLVAACFALRIGAHLRGEPWITWGSIAHYDAASTAVFLLLYGPHCLLQEFIARGVVQTSLERFLSPSRRALPILGASAFFAIFHLHVSLSFAVLTFAMSVLFGAIYARHRTLAGVSLAHAAVGLASVAVGLN